MRTSPSGMCTRKRGTKLELQGVAAFIPPNAIRNDGLIVSLKRYESIEEIEGLPAGLVPATAAVYLEPRQAPKLERAAVIVLRHNVPRSVSASLCVFEGVLTSLDEEQRREQDELAVKHTAEHDAQAVRHRTELDLLAKKEEPELIKQSKIRDMHNLVSWSAPEP